jgi:anthranilate phosphoribosyltransferase
MFGRQAAASSVTALREFLRSSGDACDERWQTWARGLLATNQLNVELLASFWREVLDFDPVLAGYIAEPLEVRVPAVIVAGSGKETFKTFNVSTAASILAAAAGAYVVKGVSRSVSAVSGSADVLDQLGLPVTDNPNDVPSVLEHDHIAFVSYAAFCPTYAGRYDGVFPFLSPFSFFMPVAVLGVRAAGFVYGIAHPDVSLVAAALRDVRPDLGRGVIVSTELGPEEVMDERAGYGISYTAELQGGSVHVFRGAHPPAPEHWRAAVAHRDSHAANAELLLSSLAPSGCAACADLVERNAAMILLASRPEYLDEAAALIHVRNIRLAGAALQLLTQLRAREEANPCYAH